MRFVAIALAVFAAGCADDTVLRIDIPDPGTSPAPVSLRVTLVGVSAAPRTIAPVTFPGTIVVTHVPSSVGQLCVDVEGLDDAGDVIVGGASLVAITAHKTARATVSLSVADESCATLVPDDLAIGGPDDMAGSDGGGGGDLATSDMRRSDMAQVQICPTGSIFCDDFETGNFSKWTATTVKLDAGSTTVQTAFKAHGTYAMKALGNGSPSPGDVYAEAVKLFTPTAPPLALRANVYFPATLGSFDHVIALYEDNTSSTNEFSIGGDNNNTWVVTENEANAPDEHSDMVPTTAGQWHCVELVIDAGGMVTLWVDNHKLIGPWQRASNVTYSTLLIGVTRSVTPDLVAYIDDVAVGPSRLYCPP
ncbi:MAG TPA: hypothetical protein VF334_11025 [Polyangia bacterium]